MEEEEEVVQKPDDREEEPGDGYQSVDHSHPTGVEIPDVIDLRKHSKKEADKPLYQVLEKEEEKIHSPGHVARSMSYVCYR